MKSILTLVTALCLAASTAFAQLTVNTPLSVVQCEPLLITWTGGTGPYFLSINPGGDPTGPAILNFPGTYTGTSLSWLVSFPPGTAIIFNLKDSTGTLSQSASVTVQNGGPACNTSTLSISPSPTNAPASGGSTSTGSSGNSPATTTPSTPNTSTGSSSSASGTAKKTGGTSSSTATSSTSTKSAGATRVTGQIAAAGIVGAAMVALLG